VISQGEVWWADLPTRLAPVPGFAGLLLLFSATL
jgi:hypothetical protein